MKTETFIGVNGILSDGVGSTDKLLLKLAEHYHSKVKDFKYRRVGYFDVGLRLRKNTSNKFVTTISNRLIELRNTCKEPVSIIAHSFGCLVTLRALQNGLIANNVYLFAPAVNEDEFIETNNVNKVFVIHNYDDFTVKLGSMLLFHDFGGMGVCGSSQVHEKIWNIPFKTYQKVNIKTLINGLFNNHGAYFDDKHIDEWVSFIANHCNLSSE